MEEGGWGLSSLKKKGVEPFNIFSLEQGPD